MPNTRIDPREIRGLISATVTPFDDQGQIDFPSLRGHLERVASTSGLYGVCVSGHAGEVLALSSEENAQVIKAARELVSPWLWVTSVVGFGLAILNTRRIARMYTTWKRKFAPKKATA
jgi:4-hydroxy-tetrahydrodipicolinate synthase